MPNTTLGTEAGTNPRLTCVILFKFPRHAAGDGNALTLRNRACYGFAIAQLLPESQAGILTQVRVALGTPSVHPILYRPVLGSSPREVDGRSAEQSSHGLPVLAIWAVPGLLAKWSLASVSELGS